MPDVFVTAPSHSQARPRRDRAIVLVSPHPREWNDTFTPTRVTSFASPSSVRRTPPRRAGSHRHARTPRRRARAPRAAALARAVRARSARRAVGRDGIPVVCDQDTHVRVHEARADACTRANGLDIVRIRARRPTGLAGARRARARAGRATARRDDPV